MRHTEIEERLPLYALDALPESEAEQVGHHVMSCDTCRFEVDRHRAAVALLVPDSPAPSHVWDRIASEIADSTSTVAPLEVGARAPSDRSAPRWLAATAVAAALALGVVVIGQMTRSPERSVIAEAQRAEERAGTVGADFVADGVAVATVVLTDEGRGYVLPTNALEPLTDDRTYQLWVINAAAEVISAGVLGAEPTPSTFTWTGDVTGFALTREVAGGVVSSAGDVVALIEGL